MKHGGEEGNRVYFCWRGGGRIPLHSSSTQQARFRNADLDCAVKRQKAVVTSCRKGNFNWIERKRILHGESSRAPAEVAWGPACKTTICQDFHNLSRQGPGKLFLTLELALLGAGG